MGFTDSRSQENLCEQLSAGGAQGLSPILLGAAPWDPPGPGPVARPCCAASSLLQCPAAVGKVTACPFWLIIAYHVLNLSLINKYLLARAFKGHQ